MWIDELQTKTTKELVNSLESGPTINWRKLMMQEFGAFYTERDVEDFEKYRHPAKKLLDDLIGRRVTVEKLLNALERIGNKKAMSIIQKDCGSHHPLQMRQPSENTCTCSPCLGGTNQNICDWIFGVGNNRPRQ